MRLSEAKRLLEDAGYTVSKDAVENDALQQFYDAAVASFESESNEVEVELQNDEVVVTLGPGDGVNATLTKVTIHEDGMTAEYADGDIDEYAWSNVKEGKRCIDCLADCDMWGYNDYRSVLNRYRV